MSRTCDLLRKSIPRVSVLGGDFGEDVFDGLQFIGRDLDVGVGRMGEEAQNEQEQNKTVFKVVPYKSLRSKRVGPLIQSMKL